MTERPVVHIVDDEEAIRKSAGFMLRTAGYAVHTWPSGVAFLKEARHAPMGCILLDVRMPEMDGLEVQATLAERGIAMPVIILTGHGDVGTAVRAMKGGAVDFLEKPFERLVLLGMVEAAIGRIEDADRHAAEADAARVRIAALTPRPAQQDDRVRFRHQPAHGRGPPRQSDGEARRAELSGCTADRVCSGAGAAAGGVEWIHYGGPRSCAGRSLGRPRPKGCRHAELVSASTAQHA
jgi:two-component system response regulator FixJ